MAVLKALRLSDSLQDYEEHLLATVTYLMACQFLGISRTADLDKK
jgi:hypothetical protein